MKKVMKMILVLMLLGGIGYAGYYYYQTTKVDATAEAPAYVQATIAKGNLSKSVAGTGTLSIGETQDVQLNYEVTVTGTIVEAGDVVAPGDAILNIDQEILYDTIATMQEELDTCESDIAAISDSYSNTKYVSMPLDGRVKETYLEKGRKIEDIMAEKGCVALLSLDGWMYVEIDAPEGMIITDTVRVKVARSTYVDGTVREIVDGKAKITFSDAYVTEGAEVELTYQKNSLGTAQAYINMPYQLTISEKGYISDAYLEVNKRKWEGNRIAYLINVPVSDEYATLQNKRDKLTNQITQAREMMESGMLTTSIDGIVSSVATASADAQVAYATLASLYVGDKKQMIVSVDELDIISVQVGQEVDIVMDAISDKVYSATVAHVSQIGTAESGVTVYSVTLAIDGDDQLKIGMNGTATIKVEEVNDVLLVPISALNSSRNGQYVWLLDESVSTEENEPGVRTWVETGLSDENYAQVLSGLAEGDTVMITRESSSSSSEWTNPNGNMMMNFGGGEMGMPQGGGAMPQGGGTRQSAPSRTN